MRHCRDGPIFSGAYSCRRLMLDDRQIGVGQHRQGDVAVPALSPAYLVPIRSHLLLGLLEAFLHGPAAAVHLHQFAHCGSGRAKAHVIGQLIRLGNAAPGQ